MYSFVFNIEMKFLSVNADLMLAEKSFSAASCVNFHSDPYLEQESIGLISAYRLPLSLCNSDPEG